MHFNKVVTFWNSQKKYVLLDEPKTIKTLEAEWAEDQQEVPKLIKFDVFQLINCIVK